MLSLIAVSFYCHFLVSKDKRKRKATEMERLSPSISNALEFKPNTLGWPYDYGFQEMQLCRNMNFVFVRWKVQSYNIIRIPGVWRCPHASALSFWWTLHCFCQASYPWDLALFDSCSDNSPRHPLHPQLSWCCLLWLLEDLWNIQFWFPCLKKERKFNFFPIFFYHTLCLKVNN